MRKLKKYIYLLGVLFFAYSCGGRPIVDTAIMDPKVGDIEVFDKLPIEVGLLIKKNSKKYVFRGNMLMENKWVLDFPLQESLREVSFQTFSQLFHKVNLMQRLNEARNYQIYIVPEIENFFWKIKRSGFVGTQGTYFSTIRIKVTVFRGKNVIWEKSVETTQAVQIVPSQEVEVRSGKSASMAMVSAFKRIAKDMAEDPIIIQVAKGGFMFEEEPPAQKASGVSKTSQLAVAEPTDQQISERHTALFWERQDLGSYYALVIGVNNYTSFRPLKTAVSDAKAVADVLRDLYGFRTKLILNGTRRDIISALDKLRGELTQKDNLLVYYAGHGYFDEDADRGYWLPVDASGDSSADWISNADITDKLKALLAKHVMVVADSCYSGTLTRGIKVTMRSSTYLKRLLAKKSRTVLTSGGLEPVMDAGGGEHSVFAEAFLNALRSNISVVDGTQLFVEVREQVRLAAPQDPQYSNVRFAGHEIGGDFLFVRKQHKHSK